MADLLGLRSKSSITESRVDRSCKIHVHYSDESVAFEDGEEDAGSKDWIEIDNVGARIVREIKKTPGLNYKITTTYADGYNGVSKTIIVSDKIGKIVKMYVNADGYSDMDLNEFICKMLSSTLPNE